MKSVNDQVIDIKIAYIGGGSRGWAWSLMIDLALEPQLQGLVRLYDIDYQAACDNERIGNMLTQRKDAVGKWQYEAARSLGDALAGVDFVVISILPGTFREMSSDVHLPEEYGIYQSVGDTTGPGGLVRALRVVPMYVEIAEYIREYSPDAWVINYTNPMSICTRTLYEAFPRVKAFGCCHEVFGTQRLLADMLRDMTKSTKTVPREEVKVNALGVNHFTWINEASYKDIDLMPLFNEFANRYYEEGFKKEDAREIYFTSYERVKFDLFRRHGLIPAASDRHLAEFMPSWYYLKDPETVETWKFHLTPVDWRIRHRQELKERCRKLVSGQEQLKLEPSGEEGVLQIRALLGLGDLITNVNLPNRRQVKGLPHGAVVETNALFSRNSVRPVLAGELPFDVKNLVIRHVLNQETILIAALERDKELAFRAFVNDPLVTISVDRARELFNEMLVSTKDYLIGWDI